MTDWGESIPDDAPKIAKVECPSCGFQPAKGYNHLYNFVVGFRENPPSTSSDPICRPYALIVQCPECQQKFWFHIGKAGVAGLKQHHKWPKGISTPEA